MSYRVYVISHLRPKAVEKMSLWVGAATWCVGTGEGPTYQAAGAERVVETGGLCRSRNWALEDAFARGVACVQVSDDLRGLARIDEIGKNAKTKIPLRTAVEHMMTVMARVGARYAGCAPTANPFFTQREVSTRHFIVGDFITVLPTELRFDEGLRLKEDYDFTAQHLQKYGAVARCDTLMAQFAHRTNAGGAVSYRTSEKEREAIDHLKVKWPGWFVDNPRRPDEILLKAPKPS